MRCQMAFEEWHRKKCGSPFEAPAHSSEGQEETMPFEELLGWASNRPMWQRDALRRLAEQGELTEANLSELRRHIEIEERLLAEAPPAPIPLAAEHLSEATSNEPKTVVAS